MYTICLIGPFPPPMNGNSKALDTLVNSEIFNNTFKCYKLNLSNGKGGAGLSGRFSMEKVRRIISVANRIRKLKKERIDCFYLTTAQSSWGILRDYTIVQSIKKTNPEAKIIAHLHGGGFRDFYNKSPNVIKRIVEKTYINFDKVIVLSESLINMFEGIYPKEKISVRYNCVDDEFLFDKNDINSKNMKSTGINVTYLSNMIESKGYNYLFEVATRLRNEYPSIHFFFAGNFSNEKMKKSFVKAIDEDCVKDTVHYLGIVSGERKKKLLAETDIFVLPTRYPPEGQPISIIEAMGAGAVIITTDQGGIPDIVKTGINGFIIKNNYVNEIISKILILAADDKLRREISFRNHNYVLQKFTESHYVNGVIKEIQSVMASLTTNSNVFKN